MGCRIIPHFMALSQYLHRVICVHVCIEKKEKVENEMKRLKKEWILSRVAHIGRSGPLRNTLCFAVKRVSNVIFLRLLQIIWHAWTKMFFIDILHSMFRWWNTLSPSFRQRLPSERQFFLSALDIKFLKQYRKKKRSMVLVRVWTL